MTARLGLNIGGPDDSDPAEIAATGATFVRTVYRETIPRPWLQAFKDHGLDVLLVGDSSDNSLGKAEQFWAQRMLNAKAQYGDLVKQWTFGNEPDGTGIASWTMPKDQVNRLLIAARVVFPAGQFILSSPGLVSGNTDWPKGLHLDLVDLLEVHLYAQFVDTEPARANLDGMVTRYLAYGLPLRVGEYDSRTSGLSTYFRDRDGVVAAAPFCWRSSQTAAEGIDGMGVRDNPTAMASFVAATGGPVVARHEMTPPPPISPPENRPHYVLGFAQFAAACPELVGEPLENERGGLPDFSQQRTSRGILTAANIDGQGWKLLFWESGTGARYLFNGKKAVEIA